MLAAIQQVSALLLMEDLPYKMSGLIKVTLLCLCCCLVYFALWPVPIEPQTWQAPTGRGYVGDFAANSKLDQFEYLSAGKYTGPEAAVEGADGMIYTTSHEGWILRWSEQTGVAQAWVKVGGRPLGLAFDKQNNLWVANAFLGLQKVTPAGEVSIELDETNGIPVVYADDLDIAPNGKIYLSDASTRFSAKEVGDTLEASLLDIMEHSDNGRIIEFDPKTGNSKTIMADLTFANGVAADPAGRFILVAETGEYRVHRIELGEQNFGQHRVVIDNLPGFPDNIHLGQNGRYWVGLASPRSEVLDDLAGKPFLRKMTQRLPAFMRPQPQLYGMVFAIDGEGKVLANLQSPTGKVYTTTGVVETKRHIYVTSLTAPFLAKYLKSELAIE